MQQIKTNKQTSIVSIILPIYNSKEERLSEAITSILNQTFKNFELIIINDASTNNIEQTILELTKKDNRIIYVKNENTLKLTKTLNKWLSIANWKYIARIDDDDIRCDPQKLELQVDFMEKHKEYWLLWTNGITINPEWKELYKLIKPCSDEELRKKIIIWNRFIHSSIIMRKSSLNQVWWFYDESWDFVEDYELWLRLWRVSKIGNLSNISVKYRINDNWISMVNHRKQKFLTLKLLFKYYKYYPKTYMIYALIFKIWDLIIPPTVTKFIMNKIRNVKV